MLCVCVSGAHLGQGLFTFLVPFALEDAGWPLALVFPTDYRVTERQLLQQGRSPMPLHSKGCLLVLPHRNSRRRKRRRATPAKHPPLYPRSISERKRWLRLREHGRTSPTSSVSTALATTKVFAGAAFGGNWLEYLRLGWQCLCLLEPTQELPGSSWGKSCLSPNAEPIPAPSPFRVWELVLGEAGEWWSQSWLGTLPSLFTSIPHGASLRIITERKLIQDINFF